MSKWIQIVTMSLVLGFGSVTLSGCSVFGKMFKKKKSRSQLRKEKRAKFEKMAKVEYEKLSAQKGCDGIKEGYAKIYSYAAGSKERRTKTAVHLAKCGHWELVFGKYSHSNQRFLNHTMNALVAEKLPVHKEYDKWLSSTARPYKGATGWYVFTWMRNWLSKASNPKQHCRAMWENRERATRRMYPKYRWRVRSMMIGYLMMAECKQFKSNIVSLLTSNSWRDRNQACHFMKDWGSSSDARKLRAIATTDSYSYIRRRVRIFPVRDACRSALGRVQMRT